MYNFLESNKLLHDKQFGFRAKHSTNHALISLSESLKSYLDTQQVVGGIFIDLETTQVVGGIFIDLDTQQVVGGIFIDLDY